MHQQNRRPERDFHGLSGEQMDRILYHPFDSLDVLRFADVVSAAADAPVMKLFSSLVGLIQRGDVVEPSDENGLLPLNVVREIADEVYDEQTFPWSYDPSAMTSERDFEEFQVVRSVAQWAGLISSDGRRFIPTDTCRDLLDSGGLPAVYLPLSRTYTERYEWGSIGNWPDVSFLQDSFGFILYLLQRYGDTWREEAFYSEQFLRAFPIVITEFEKSGNRPRALECLDCYTVRVVEWSCGLMGLSEMRLAGDDSDRPVTAEIRATPLLRELVSFHV